MEKEVPESSNELWSCLCFLHEMHHSVILYNDFFLNEICNDWHVRCE